MYTPKVFGVDDPESIASFVREHGFGLLITVSEGRIDTTLTPMYLTDDRTQVLGHIAKANLQWRHWTANPDAKLIFQGPHTYISPSDYLSDGNVPTWNYTAVTIEGTIEAMDSSDAKLQVVQTLAGQYESSRESPWQLDTGDDKLMGLLDGIVAFSVQVRSITAKFKLNQNKTPEDRRSVIESLRRRGGDSNLAIANLMASETDGHA